MAVKGFPFGVGDGGLAGDGSGDIYVDLLGEAADAEVETTYVRESDNTQWRVGSETVPEVRGYITKSTIVPPNDQWIGSKLSDPTNASLINAAAYYKTDTDVFRRKPMGSYDGTIEQGDVEPTGGAITWLDSATSDPVSSATAAYFNSSTNRFRIKAEGTTTTESITASNASFHDSSSFTVLSPRATEPTSTIGTGQTELLYNNDQ